jgi:tetratricopeptide (TPR) repeat protein
LVPLSGITIVLKMGMEEEEENIFELLHLVDSFNKMLTDQTVRYYDVDQFEAISDYFFDTGKISKALLAVQLASEQHPASPNFMARKVQFLTAANKTQEAKKAMDRLEQLAPDSFDLHMSRAGLQSKQHNHQKAIYHLKKALNQTEFPEDVWPLLAAEYQMLGHPAKAISFLKKTLAANPQDEVALYHLATCYELANNFTGGAQFFEKFTNENPYNEVAWFQYGVMLNQIDEHEKAMAAFEYAYWIDEWFMAPYFEKATILEYHFRFEEALEVYRHALEVDEESSFIYYRMGLCYLRLHHRLKAESYFTKALKQDADFEEAYVEMALLKDEDENWSEAVFNAQKALEIDSSSVEHMHLNASILRRAGQLQEAELMYEKMANTGYTQPILYIDWAELLFEMCEFDHGMEILREGVKRNPKEAIIHYRLGGYLYAMQKDTEADRHFRKALSLDADARILFFDLFPELREHKNIQKIVKERLAKKR